MSGGATMCFGSIATPYWMSASSFMGYDPVRTGGHREGKRPAAVGDGGRPTTYCIPRRVAVAAPTHPPRPPGVPPAVPGPQRVTRPAYHIGAAMKAAYLETTGAPDVIRYGELPTPEPK